MSADNPSTDGKDWTHLYIEAVDFHAIKITASVVHGFGRGSKELGIPTANLNMEEVGDKCELKAGIYYGWTNLKEVMYETVVSIGWNPFYKNEKKTIEAHLLQKLPDFYGERISILICGFLREECNFDKLDDLISCIHSDIRVAKLKLLEDIPAHYADKSTWPS